MKYGMTKQEFEDLINKGDNSNANLSFSPEMIVEYTYEAVAKDYNLSIMPRQCRKAYLDGFIHHHDLHGAILKPNCLNHNIRFYAKNGLKIDGKGENGAVAKPAKSLEVLLNHMLQAFMAGACVLTGGQAFTNFNTFLAPFARGRSYADIKQAIQGFIFNCNMSLVARGGQVLFSSIGLDLSIPDVLKDVPAIGPDNVVKGTYKDYEEEFNLIFRAVCEVLNEKDGQGAYFRFPNCNGFDNPIIVKHNNVLEIKPIGEFVEEMLKNNSIKYYDSVISNINNYEICSYNKNTDKIEWKPITKAIRNPNQRLYRITTKKGTHIDVTENHPFLTMTANKIGNFDGKPLSEFSKYNKLVTSKKQILPYIENKIGTFIGFFLGDGYDLKSAVNNRIGFTLYKKEKHSYLKNLLDELGFVYIERDNTFTMLDVKQKNSICAELISDCVVMKNNKLLAKYNNSKYYLGILAGLINSDGSIYQSKNIDKTSFLLKFSNTNPNLIDLFIRIGNIYGLNVKKGIKQKPVKETHNLCYDLYCGGYNMNELLNHITLHDIHTNKMFDVDFTQFKRDYGALGIKDIELIDYDGFTYDLEVKDNHNYFIGDCNVLSHNCLFSIRNGDLDKYEGNCKLLHELGANNPTIYYVNCTDAERTVMGCRTANQLNYTGDYFRDCLGAGNFMYSTLNLPLIALTYKKDFFKYLDKYIEIIYDMLKWRREQVSNTIYNKHMSDFLLWEDDEEKLYNFDTSSMTIGVCGLYECVKTLEQIDGFVNNVDDFYNDTLGVRIMKFINDKVNEFKERDGLRWGVIGSPAESTAYKFGKINVEKFPDEAIFQGTKDTPYLTNSTHIPVSHESDIIDHIRNADIYHPLTRAGNILHLWLGEVWSDAKSLWKLNQKIVNTGTQFWAYSKVFTYCQQCGYTINDNLSECPICKSKDLRVFDRISGYYLPIKGWNEGKKEEFKDRFRHMSI